MCLRRDGRQQGEGVILCWSGYSRRPATGLGGGHSSGRRGCRTRQGTERSG